MFNLIKMDMYRLFRTKSTYVIGIILLALSFLIVFSYQQMMGSGMEEFVGMKEDMTLYRLISGVLMNTLIPMVLCIGAATFICTDYSSGAIKNIGSGVTNKAMIAVSKYIVLVILAALYFVLIVVATYILGLVLIDQLVVGNIGELLQYIVANFFLNCTMLALAVLATSFFRSASASITFIVVIVLLAPIAYSLIELMIDFDFNKYSVIHNISALTIDVKDQWMSALGSASVLLVIYMGLSMFVMEKKDIK